MTVTRDPRVDPRVGDKLRHGRDAIEVTELHADGHVIGTRAGREVWWLRTVWQNNMAKAVIVTDGGT